MTLQYGDSEAHREEWRRLSMQERFACKPIVSSRGTIEDLLRTELLGRLLEWLSKTVLACVSSDAILLLSWKETLPSEDAARFGLVEGLHMMPARLG